MSDFQEEEAEGAEFDEGVSSEEKVAIGSHFMLSSPPGQFNEVLSDVRKLVGGDLISDQVASSAARVFNLKTGVVVTDPTGQKVVVAKEGEIKTSTYLNSHTGTLFGFNHLTRQVSEVASDAAPPVPHPNEQHRVALQEKSDEYLKKRYVTTEAATGVFALSKTVLILRIIGEKTNLRNMWSGKWSSEWTITMRGTGQVSLAGSIRIHAHYFEDGNVQVNTTKNIPSSDVSYTSETDLAINVMKIVSECEAALHNGLVDMYFNLNEHTFKAMRRLLPVTRTKMDWNMNSHKLARNVSGRK
jgi:capping protein (actin filament) muscle Z-line, alpha